MEYHNQDIDDIEEETRNAPQVPRVDNNMVNLAMSKIVANQRVKANSAKDAHTLQHLSNHYAMVGEQAREATLILAQNLQYAREAARDTINRGIPRDPRIIAEDVDFLQNISDISNIDSRKLQITIKAAEANRALVDQVEDEAQFVEQAYQDATTEQQKELEQLEQAEQELATSVPLGGVQRDVVNYNNYGY